MTISDIRACLETHLQDLSGMPDIAWENISFEPTLGQSFVEVFLQPTRERPSHLGPSPQLLREGLFLININIPRQDGPEEGDTLAELITDHFNTDTDLDFNGTVVRLRYAEKKASVTLENWYIQPVVIEYYSFE